MATVKDLKETDQPDLYRKLNQFSWELSMWLPDDIYKKMGKAITNPNSEDNLLSVAIAVRKFLLGKMAGNLTQNDIIHHKPGTNKLKSNI